MICWYEINHINVNRNIGTSYCNKENTPTLIATASDISQSFSQLPSKFVMIFIYVNVNRPFVYVDVSNYFLINLFLFDILFDNCARNPFLLNN